MKRLLVLLAATAAATTGMALVDYNDSVHWTGTGDWTNLSNWAETPGLGDDWVRPGWVVGNPVNTNNSTDVNWNRGYAHIDNGTVNITPGSHPDGTVRSMWIGSNDGNSTINISTDFTVREKIYAGYQSRVTDVATINQTAGNVTYGTTGASRTYWGRGLGTITYNLSGGTMATPGDWEQFGNNVDDADDGASVFNFNQTGGIYTDSGANGLVMADKAPSIVNVNISGGVFNASALETTRIADEGTVDFTVQGTGEFRGSSAVTAVGYYASAHGTVNLKDSAKFTTEDDLYIGRSGTGVFNQTGGSLTMKSFSDIGHYGGSHGTLNLDGGSVVVTNTGDYYIGRSGNGTLNQTGGSFEAYTRVTVGRYNDGVGTLNISGGTFTMHGSDFYLGYTNNTVGVVNQTGGAMDVTRLILGQEEGTSGTYTISGGSLIAQNYITGRKGERLFEVVGSGATSIETHRIYFWEDHFRVELDENGSTLVRVTAGNGYDGKIDLRRALFEVDTLASFDGQVGDTYDIMWSEAGIDIDQAGYTDRDMIFSNLSGTVEFSYAVVAKDGGEVLQLTVIPEPGTLGLLAVMGGGLFWFRRFRN